MANTAKAIQRVHDISFACQEYVKGLDPFASTVIAKELQTACNEILTTLEDDQRELAALRAELTAKAVIAEAPQAG
jgi:hypothetical protein